MGLTLKKVEALVKHAETLATREEKLQFLQQYIDEGLAMGIVAIMYGEDASDHLIPKEPDPVQVSD